MRTGIGSLYKKNINNKFRAWSSSTLSQVHMFSLQIYLQRYNIVNNHLYHIRNGINYKVRQDLIDPAIEGIWIETTPTKSKSFLFSTI